MTPPNAPLLELAPGLRALFAAATSMALVLLLGRPAIACLRRMRVGERTDKTPIEDDELRGSIARKQGTPTMGGIFLLASVLVASLLWADTSSTGVLAALLCTVVLAGLGAVDDVLKLIARERTERGLKVRWKLAVQGLAGAGFAALVLAEGARGTVERLSALRPGAPLPQSWGALLFVAGSALLVATMSNSANVTDGMDGLLAGLGALLAVALGIACSAAGSARAAQALGITHVPSAAEAAVLCGAAAGACVGFLHYNRHPARVFMGDTGSLAVGGLLACAALAARQEAVLVVGGLVLLAEFGSSLLQIGAFKLFGRRVLPVAPAHYILQKQGHPEPSVVRCFYVGGIASAVCAIALFCI